MGIIASDANGLGVEGAGDVSEVGPDVLDLAVGDSVFLFEFACFSSEVVISKKLCAKIPDSLSFEDAATMPCVFATVIACLVDVGRLQRGQVRILHFF